MAENDWLNESNSGIQPSSGERYGGSKPGVRHELRPLTTGEILDRTFFLYRSNFWLYVGLASIAAGASALMSIARLAYFRLNGPMPPTSPKAVIASGVITIVGLLLYFAVYSVTHAATVSAVSSLYLGEETSMGAALGAVRGHWGIENHLHWQLDISFGEDQSRIQEPHAADLLEVHPDGIAAAAGPGALDHSLPRGCRVRTGRNYIRRSNLLSGNIVCMDACVTNFGSRPSFGRTRQ